MIGDIMSISRLRMGTDGKGVSTLVAFLTVHYIVYIVQMIIAMKKNAPFQVHLEQHIHRRNLLKF